MSLHPIIGSGDPSDTGIYNGVVTNSLRMNGSDATLQRTLVNSTDGSRQKNVWSFWVKFGLDSSPNPYFYSKGNGGGVADIIYISLTSLQRLYFIGYVSDSVTHELTTVRQFRDSNAWYHIVVAVDTTQTTDSNKVCVYVNGEKQTFGTNPSGSSANYPGTNALLAMNWYQTGNAGSTIEQIGDYYASQSSDYRINGCLAEYHSVDGLSFFSDTSGTENSSFNINSFGETKQGIWIPKAYNGAHGTQGYHLKFDNESVASASSSTVGADSAGSNHWTSNNIVVADCNNFDSPENNVCVINSVDRRYGHTQDAASTTTNGLLLATENGSTSNQTHHFGTHIINDVVSEGGVYFEFRVVAIDASRCYLGLVATSSFENNSANGAGVASYQYPRKCMLQLGGMYFLHNTNQTGASDDIRTGNTVFSATDIGGMAILSNGKVFMHRNGTYLKDSSGNTGNPNTGAYPLHTLDLTTYKWLPYSGYSGGTSIHFNFGQDPTFDAASSVTAPDPVKTDANGLGKFLYDVPTNCLALCSSNMPDPAIIEPKNHFDVLKYVGNSANDSSGSTQSISGLDFKPDWVWIKNRDTNADHRTVDSSRGPQKTLYISGGSYYENEGADGTDGITSFTAASTSGAGGFSVGQHTGFNKNTDDFVAWNWLAGGTSPSKTYKVVVVSDSGNKYRFRNSADDATFAQSAVTLDLQEGGTYTFDWSDSTAQSHPIRFSLTADGTHGSGSEYTTGVVKDDSAYKTTITVASGVATLYYYCQYHSGMGGQVNTNTTHGSTNFDGSILSVVQSNTTAGFSIVTFTGNGSNDATIGHGVQVNDTAKTPAMIITKNRDEAQQWRVHHQELPDNYILYLAENYHQIAPNGSNNGYIKTVGATTYSTYQSNADSLGVNGSSDKMVSYCFAEVDGYSKFGGYNGNGADNDDGVFIWTGFRPAFLMYKRNDANGPWLIDDSTTQPFNPDSNYLVANTTDGEGDTGENDAGHIFDMYSNGFKLRNTNTDRNAQGGDFVYMAFAEQPFKYANAR